MTESELNLLAAFQNYNPGSPILHTYRVYYDATTGLCTRTDVLLHDDPFVEVDKKTFENFNPIFYRVVDGKIRPREIDYTYKKVLIRGNGPYKTIKGTAMFLVDNSYTKAVQHWKLNDS
jgi:hypothetical protein